MHKRHKRAMAPAFGLVEAKALLPYFMDAVTKACELYLYLISEADSGPYRQMADKWSNIIENGESGRSATIDVNMWLGKATLDACVLALVLDVRGLRINRDLASQGSARELSTMTLGRWTRRITHLPNLTRI